MQVKKDGKFFLLVVVAGIIFAGVVVLPDLLSLTHYVRISSTQDHTTESSSQTAQKTGMTVSSRALSRSEDFSFSGSSKNVSKAKTVTLFSGNVRRGDTLYDFLRKSNISSQKSYLILKHLRLVFNPKYCKPGDKLEVQKNENGLVLFKYFPRGLKYYVVEEIKPDVFSARVEEIPKEKILIGAKGKISSSLYEAMKNEGLNNELIMKFADIFSWEIDFLTDPRKGDEFQLIWERYVDKNGKVLMDGKIVAAQYINRGKKHTAIHYSDPQGKGGYYTPEGKSLRKAFLRSPLHYRRISSYFSYRRFHPILKIYRPHLGIDYAAPTGTPVSTVADGTVIFVGWRGGYGRCVRIKHPGGYITSYGHLSRFARGIKKGKKVVQGQVIGYVGATGLATGPHLDFRITKNGRYLNFLKLKLPRASSVNSKYLQDFYKIRDFYVANLDFLAQSSQNMIVLSPESYKNREEVALNTAPQFLYSPSTLFPLKKEKYLI